LTLTSKLLLTVLWSQNSKSLHLGSGCLSTRFKAFVFAKIPCEWRHRVKDFKDCVAGRTPYLVAEKTGRSVTCRTCGNNSATAGELRDFIVPNLAQETYDYVIINIGTNDAKNFHTATRFKKEFGGLLYALNAKFPDAKVIWSGIIDVSKIPLLPSPLNKLMGIRASILRRKADELCFERAALAPKTKWRIIEENFSEDGFHASSKGYEEWAEELSAYIADLQDK